MSNLLHVSSSPHIRSKITTDWIMYMVLIALLPATCMGVYLFGVPALILIVCSVVTCVATEYIYERLMHKPITIKDGSAMVTGLLLALNLPSGATWWMAVLGGVFAILVVKQLFGGLGQNIMNPALAARCFLMISFAARMTDFSTSDSVTAKLVDTVSGATPLAEIKAGGSWDLMSMFLGNTRGTIGETSALLLLIGGIFLVAMKIIDLRIPLTYIGTFAVFALLFGGHGFDLSYVAAELCGGGLMLGAWFMATDYVTRPVTGKGQYVYGVILGILTGVFRIFGGSAEGVSYAIIFTNLLVPIIERLTLPGGFGIVKQKGGKKS
ncbi:MAG: RnfABCDGE type electron transport complex subunit D [Lacrimispora saccharolytica]